MSVQQPSTNVLASLAAFGLAHPQDEVCPRLSLLLLTIVSPPQSQTHRQRILPSAAASDTGSIAVRRPNFLPRRSFARGFAHPQLLEKPERSHASGTSSTLPQEHLHRHVPSSFERTAVHLPYLLSATISPMPPLLHIPCVHQALPARRPIRDSPGGIVTALAIRDRCFKEFQEASSHFAEAVTALGGESITIRTV